VLNFAIIKNAYQGIVTQLPSPNGGTKVTLTECIIDNIYDAGVLCLASTLNARNCLIVNCGNNIGIAAGGVYNFTHCTVASYGNLFLQHKTPVLYITNLNTLNVTNAVFRNCIFYGEGGIVDDEIFIENKGTAALNLSFQIILYKSPKTDLAATYPFANPIRNKSPEFDSIDAGRRYFEFRLKTSSPAVNSGANTGTLIDLDGKTRTGVPDLGCYEKQ
jgi:hypothetical protein